MKYVRWLIVCLLALTGSAHAQGIILRSSPALTGAATTLVLKVGQYDIWNLTLTANTPILFSVPTVTGAVPFRINTCQNAVGGWIPTFTANGTTSIVNRVGNGGTITSAGANLCDTEFWTYNNDKNQLVLESVSFNTGGTNNALQCNGGACGSFPNGSPPQIAGYGSLNTSESETVGGDCTFARASPGNYTLTCGFTKGVAFGTLATANAGTSLVISGTNLNVNLPGGTLAAHNFATALTSAGTLTGAQPFCSDLSNAAASCSVDTTNASNISSGTLNNARLPSAISVTSGTFSSLTSGDCVQAGAGGLLTTTNAACGAGGGGNVNAGNAGDSAYYAAAGSTISAQQGFILTIANEGVTGTTVHKLAKLTGAPSTAIISSAADTSGAVGIVIAGAGTTGSALVLQDGTTTCVFDGSTTAGDYVQISASIVGDCTDAGATYPTSNQVLGRVLSTNVGAGTYSMNLLAFDQNTPTTLPNPGLVVHTATGTTPALGCTLNGVQDEYDQALAAANVTPNLVKTNCSTGQTIIYKATQGASGVLVQNFTASSATINYALVGGAQIQIGAASGNIVIIYARFDGTNWNITSESTVPAQAAACAQNGNCPVATITVGSSPSVASIPQPNMPVAFAVTSAATNVPHACWKTPTKVNFVNWELTVDAFTASVNPVLSMCDTGASATPTACGTDLADTATITAVGNIETALTSGVNAGEYVCVFFKSGTATVFNASGSAAWIPQ